MNQKHGDGHREPEPSSSRQTMAGQWTASIYPSGRSKLLSQNSQNLDMGNVDNKPVNGGLIMPECTTVLPSLEASKTSN